MKTRPLGKSNIEASVVGFGAWAIGGWMWGGADERQAIRAIHAFLDAGGTLIDTAPVYGFGVSEEIVGRAIAERRDQVVLVTKCGMRWDLTDQQKERADLRFSTTKKVFDLPGQRSPDSFDVYIYNGADGIREEVDRSLTRLQTDVIDLYLTHWQQDATPISERMEVLQALKQEGKIRAIGICNSSSAQLDEYQQHGQLDADQEKYSMLDRELEPTNLAKCAADNIAFLAYSPMAQGLLSGKITPERKYEDGDQRLLKPRFEPDNVRKVQAMLEPMRGIADRHNASLAQLTLAWTLAQPGCSHVLAGARNEEQALDNLAAGQIGLSGDELRSITAAVNSFGGI